MIVMWCKLFGLFIYLLLEKYDGNDWSVYRVGDVIYQFSYELSTYETNYIPIFITSLIYFITNGTKKGYPKCYFSTYDSVPIGHH